MDTVGATAPPGSEQFVVFVSARTGTSVARRILRMRIRRNVRMPTNNRGRQVEGGTR